MIALAYVLKSVFNKFISSYADFIHFRDSIIFDLEGVEVLERSTAVASRCPLASAVFHSEYFPHSTSIQMIQDQVHVLFTANF